MRREWIEMPAKCRKGVRALVTLQAEGGDGDVFFV